MGIDSLSVLLGVVDLEGDHVLVFCSGTVATYSATGEKVNSLGGHECHLRTNS